MRFGEHDARRLLPLERTTQLDDLFGGEPTSVGKAVFERREPGEQHVDP
jgi:hypothetical protein